jgi:hypothetical protein
LLICFRGNRNGKSKEIGYEVAAKQARILMLTLFGEDADADDAAMARFNDGTVSMSHPIF